MKRIEKKIERLEEWEPLREVLMRLGDRWSLAVLATLGTRRLRFNALRRDIGGVSQRMLTVSLRSLERDGLLVRTAFATIPPRVEYEVSPRGQSLFETLSPIRQWIATHCDAIADFRRCFDLEPPKAAETVTRE
jgi:DNA-binding HxlR family transcriptional regulator